MKGNESLLLRDNGYIYLKNNEKSNGYYWRCRRKNCKGFGRTDKFKLIEDKQGNIYKYEVYEENNDGSSKRTANINFKLTTKHNHQRNII